MTKLRTVRLPIVPSVPGAPTAVVGNRLSTPFFSSTMIVRRFTPRIGNRPSSLTRPYMFGTLLIASVNATMLNADELKKSSIDLSSLVDLAHVGDDRSRPKK